MKNNQNKEAPKTAKAENSLTVDGVRYDFVPYVPETKQEEREQTRCLHCAFWGRCGWMRKEPCYAFESSVSVDFRKRVFKRHSKE